ncbi:hypothetical protein [Caulobacter sp. BE254]|uniref:hypothetical protein n=1 Tax=Caulobacter sp. BE254 TaxID=2817720 RepID=UPI00286424EC|nr:hypothetical protein [Caulobacter sp. BE254]MDR7116816.1 hypothetical protein [Caulobacter sp. BE254]
MDKRAIVKAASRLRVAEKAAAELAECKTHEAFTDTWYTFLTASKNVYTILEQGAKTDPRSRQWYGGVAAERRGDDLLQYIYEARNDDEHGLEEMSEAVPGSLSVGVTKPGFSNRIRLDGTLGGPPGTALTITPLDGLPILSKVTSPHIRLRNVKARGNRVLAPPASHLGRPLQNASPLGVAEATIAYLGALIGRADALT